MRAVREIVTQPACAEAAARARQYYVDVDGPGRAADALIERLRMPAAVGITSSAQPGREARHFQ
jgi:hypothetical protein